MSCNFIAMYGNKVLILIYSAIIATTADESKYIEEIQ